MSRNREGVPLCLAIPLLAWQFALLISLRHGMPHGQSYSLQMIPFREQLNMGLPPIKPFQFVAIYLLLAVVFVLTVLAFLPIGQLCGRLMERTKQLKAYGLNLLGSVLGVSFMFFLSFFWTPPLVWFGISFLMLIFFVVRSKKSLLFAATAALLALLILAYLPMLGLVVLLSLVLYRRFFSEKPQATHAPFFFLGAGFMLVETKAITELGRTFGNTWEVIGMSIASILTMSYLSNSAVQWLRSRNSFWPHLFVLASRLAGWWIARAGGLSSTSLGRVGTAILLTCPVFFSGMVFSSLLSRNRTFPASWPLICSVP